MSLDLLRVGNASDIMKKDYDNLEVRLTSVILKNSLNNGRTDCANLFITSLTLDSILIQVSILELVDNKWNITLGLECLLRN